MYEWQTELPPHGLLWAHLMHDVRNAIASGHLLPGSRLPTQEQFVEAYDCSTSTVRTALQRLATLGLIIKRRSTGTIVAPDALEKLKQLDQPTTANEVQDKPGTYVLTDPAADVTQPDTASTDVDLYPGASLVVKKPTEAEIAEHRLQNDERLVAVTHSDGQVKKYGEFNTVFWLRRSPPIDT
jgi:DNA-binding GntR family transcriptional regulator